MIERGVLVRFKQDWVKTRYGATGRVISVQVALSRPFGARTTLVDIRTVNGTDVQWPLRLVRERCEVGR
jgi:hypothetical protein